MMKKTSSYCCVIMVLLLAHTDSSYSFSLRSACSSLSFAMVKWAGRNLCKILIMAYAKNYVESHGYDSESRQNESRRSGACRIPWPTYVQDGVSIAPGTVPLLIQERIEALRQGRYQWPTCRPLLLTGGAGVGKTQLAKYLAQQSQSPFMYTSAAGFMSGKENSGVQTVFELFKRSRIRSEISSWTLRFRQFFAFILRRPIPQKKPTVILIDEFDAIGKSAGNNLLEGDANLEVERDKAFARLRWEISHNKYTQNHIQAPRCPPGDFDEHWLAMRKRSKDTYLAESKRRHPVGWEFFLRKKKAETLVVAATNSRANELAPEVRDIFDIIEIQPFDLRQRQAIVEFHAQGKQFENPQVLGDLSARSEGCSAAKIASILNDAAMLAALRDDNGVIRQTDIDQVIAHSQEASEVI